jgi:hypothetical protein
VHAFELSGMRGWEQNNKVYELAAEGNVAVIAGGDRHGCEPSASLPLLIASFLWQPFSLLRRAVKTICKPAVEE